MRVQAPERIMTVCEVCGVFINCTDAEQRQLASAQALGKTALGNVTPVSKALGVRPIAAQYLPLIWDAFCTVILMIPCALCSEICALLCERSFH